MSNFWEGKNILITGATGFVGSWITEILSSESFKSNVNIYGLIRRQANPSIENIKHLLNEGKIKLIRGDLHDTGSLVQALKESKAEIVFHLAAQSFVPHSFSSPLDTLVTNVIGTTNLLEAVKIVNKDIRVHFAGSSEEYGLVIVDDDHYKRMLDRYKIILPPPDFDENGKVIPEIPIKETNPLRTVGTSPYGCSKRLCEDVCRTYVSCYDMNVLVTRGFNHTGPRRGREFVSSEVTSQVAEGIKHGRKDIVLGNLEAMRDFSDVRDIIDGYLKVVEKGVPGDVYNLCSGKGMKISELMDLALLIAREEFGLKHEMKYVFREDRLRPSDLPILVGDNTKARKKFGWEPKIPIRQTIKEMIEFYLQRV